MTETTTRTEPRGRRSERSSGGGDARRWLIAFLAAFYLVAWWAFGAFGRAPEAEALPVPPPPPKVQATVVWYDELPLRERASLPLPPGLRVAARAPVAAASEPTIRPVRSPAIGARPVRPRIRTRSS